MVTGIIALGATDSQFKRAGDDLTRATQTNDVRLLYAASGGLASLAVGSIRNAHLLQSYPFTRPVGDALVKAFTRMRDGATLTRSSVDGGDARGVEAGARQMAEGLTLYAQQRGTLADLVARAVTMTGAPVR